jgi:predicted kinase
MKDATLYIFSGLPGTGKTTLSQLFARRIGAAHLRIDTIEQALRELCSIDVQGEGYRLADRVASDILKAGVDVVADSCNPIELTRREWEEAAVIGPIWTSISQSSRSSFPNGSLS